MSGISYGKDKQNDEMLVSSGCVQSSVLILQELPHCRSGRITRMSSIHVKFSLFFKGGLQPKLQAKFNAFCCSKGYQIADRATQPAEARGIL